MADKLVWLWPALLAGLTGAMLGALFFGGLWWTVRHGASSRRPALWFFGSLVLRSALVLVGFYLVGAGQPARMALCLLGFLVARGAVLRATRLPNSVQALPVPAGPPCA